MRAARAALLLARSAALLAAWMFATAPAHALFGDDEARKAILDLRTHVNELEQQQQAQQAEVARRLGERLDRLEAAQRGALEFANQMDAVRAELAKLRGQVEQLTNDLATAQKRNRDLYTDLDTRLKALEPQAVTVDGRPTQIERGEQAAYDAALAQFRGGDYKGAITNLQSFVARFPQSPYAASAQYWLGSSHYALKDYRAAITAQTQVVDRYPDSPRAPDALLNIAASQSELNERPKARATLQRIVQNYPDAEAAKVATDRLKAMGAR
jgi:tol-pal system protein YbgF